MVRQIILVVLGVAFLLVSITPPLCFLWLVLQPVRNDFGTGGLAAGIVGLATVFISPAAALFALMLFGKSRTD